MNFLAARYKAQSGTYMSVVPDAPSCGIVMDYCIPTDKGRVAVPADFHCTVMYAPDSILTPEQQLLAITKCPPSFEAYTKQLTRWVGGDSDSYVVLELECPALQDYHAWLRTELGMVSSFDDYNPHITIVSGLPASERLIVPVKRTRINLSGLRIEDAKG